jgi:anaerobic ribonucleoside-triphosphate reductase activating protein
MLRFKEVKVVFRELPNEITLAINITGCPVKCKDCHSKHLWEDIGEALTINAINQLIVKNEGITAICFMGGDSEPEYLNTLAKEIKDSISYNKYPIKIGWYSGRDWVSDRIEIKNFDYIKIGKFIKSKGSIDNPNTNQQLFRVDKHGSNYILNDITSLLWKEKQ